VYSIEQKSSFQDEVQARLKERGIMKLWLAKQVDVTPAMLSNWFAGRTVFPEWRIKKIAQVLSLD
jgi:predicted transcriptional regulator